MRDGGRIIVVDPYLSPVSRIAFTAFHSEPFDMGCNPLQSTIPLSEDFAFDANQAVATILFFKRLKEWEATCPGFRLIERKRFALLAYPATGGFSMRQLLPDRVIGMIQKWEGLLAPLAPLLAFLVLVVVEKRMMDESRKMD